MEPSSFNFSCGAFDFRALGAWYDWIKNWRAANQPLQLNELPGEALRLILDQTSLEDRAILRNTSYRLRTLVDKYPVKCKALTLRFLHNSAQLIIDNEIIIDERFDAGKGLKKSFQRTLKRMCSILRMPKLQLDELRFDIHNRSFDRIDKKEKVFDLLKSVLVSFDRQIHTKMVVSNYGSPDILMLLLKCCKPGVLEKIEHRFPSMYLFEYEKKHHMKPYCGAILNLEQWKQAVELEISEELEEIMTCLDEKCFAHFKELNVVKYQDI